MAQGFRADRLADHIREELSDIIAREVHDPGVGLITITRVQVTADLQIARVYYTTMAVEAARKATAKALARATPFLRHQLAGRLTLRRMPEVEFRFDQSVEQHDRIEKLIHQIHEEEASHPPDVPTDTPTDTPTDGPTNGPTDTSADAPTDEPPHEQ
ncbi:MAG: 30S ribosome-binding factor RbfA [Acidobacteriota bacterium]